MKRKKNTLAINDVLLCGDGSIILVVSQEIYDSRLDAKVFRILTEDGRCVNIAGGLYKTDVFL